MKLRGLFYSVREITAEIAMKKTLIGLVRSIDRSVDTYCTQDVASLEAAMQAFAVNRSAAAC